MQYQSRRAIRLTRRTILATVAAIPLYLSAAYASPSGSVTIQVTIASPGTSAGAVETKIAAPMEHAFAKLESAKNVQSTSSHGSCSLEVTFTGISEAEATSRVRQALNATKPAYPDAKIQVQRKD